MSTPKFLKNRKTGAKFPFHPRLMKNKDMVPCEDVETETEAVVITTEENPSEPVFDVATATKAQLIEYALQTHGVQLSDRDKADDLRKQVIDLDASDEGAEDDTDAEGED